MEVASRSAVERHVVRFVQSQGELRRNCLSEARIGDVWLPALVVTTGFKLVFVNAGTAIAVIGNDKGGI